MEPLGFPLEAIVVLLSVVGVSVYVDLYSHRNKTEISFKDATFWTAFWIGLAIAFYYYLSIRYGSEYASLFMAGYALEKSLSIDNMMVFVAIFAAFGIKGILQHRILYYGIIGALFFRGIFIAAGTTLFGMAPWIEIAFAAVVAWTAWVMFKGSDDAEVEDYSTHWSVRLTKKIFPILPRLQGKSFFVNRSTVVELEKNDATLNIARKGSFYATPMFLCLICIEVSDIVFSFDSVPAIIAITKEPLLVYAAVIFAILGLRSLYFMLAVAAKYLCHLEKGVALVLVFIAVKLGITGIEKTFGMEILHIPHDISLYVVLGFIGLGVLASVIWPENDDGVIIKESA
ncbi:MAG: tellurite resistance protein TerC [Motiliproteus sp.]|jgi:tellurite resistance protein TerC